MKYSCEIIRDLLPLYIDDVASQSSRQTVEEHLAECAECRAVLGRLQTHETENAIAMEKESVIAGQRRVFERKSTVAGSVIAGIFMIPILVCLIVNLASGSGLSWFFIVLSALLVAASLSIVPLMAPQDKGLWTLGGFTVSLLLLFGVCCLYTGGRWFFVASASVLFGLALVFLPFVAKNRLISDYLGDRKGLAVMAADTILYAVMMLAIGLHTKAPRFFPLAAGISVPILLLAWGLFFLIRNARKNRAKQDQKGERTMKQTTIIWLVIAAFLVLAIGGAFFLTKANHKMETNTYEVTEAFQSISVFSDTEDIEFCPSDDGKCRVVCFERVKERHTVSARNGTLTVERIDSRKWYDHLSFFSFGSPTITVYLPQAVYASLIIEEDTGDISIPKDFVFDSVDLTLSTGDVDCRASSSGLLRIKTSTGNIDLEDLSAGELDLSVSTGRVDVRSVVCAGDAGITVSTGKTNLTDVSCGSLNSTGNTGDIALINVLAADTISIERSTGDVRFEQCDAGELAVVTDTGDVTGSLLSAKIFIARSDTGRVDVPETTSGGTCRITTDTGDIRIEIINELSDGE